MVLDPKNKKRKAAPVPTNTAKKVKNTARASTRAGKEDLLLPTLSTEGNPALATSPVGGATRKRAADFFDESASQSGDCGWGQVDTTQTSNPKRLKATTTKKALALKTEKGVETAITTTRVQPIEGVAGGHGAKKHVLKPGLKSPSSAEEPRKHKKLGKIGETVKEIEKVTTGGRSTRKLASGPGTAKPQGAEKTVAKGISKVEKKGHSQESTVKDTVSESDVEENGEEDDQIAALLKGFESSEGESELEHEGFTEGQAIPGLPKEKKSRKKLKGIEQTGNGTPGVIYVGRIPHGFYEHEMRSYFTQFGEIARLRLSRNRKTGRSKHYAFIEFSSSEVARIVAETMDNYLMFGHILKCKIVPQEQVHENLWKGANKRFKKIPRNRIEGRKLEAAASKESWVKKVQIEMKKRRGKAEKLKAIGYEFDVPILKRVKDIEKKETNLIAGSSEVEVTQEVTSLQEETPNTASMSEEVISKATGEAIQPDAYDPGTAIANREATDREEKDAQGKDGAPKIGEETSTVEVREERESVPKKQKRRQKKKEQSSVWRAIV